MTVDIQQAHRRYGAYTGFVTTPKYFDDSPQQFLQVAPQRTGIVQRVLSVPEYSYELDQRSQNFHLLEEAHIALAESDCEVVGQVGSNWVHCQGTTGPAEIEEFCGRLHADTGVRFLMAGHCLVRACERLGRRRSRSSTGTTGPTGPPASTPTSRTRGSRSCGPAT